MRKTRWAVFTVLLLAGSLGILLLSGCNEDEYAKSKLNVYVTNYTGETLYVNGQGIEGNVIHVGVLELGHMSMQIRINQPASTPRAVISLEGGIELEYDEERERVIEFRISRNASGEYSVGYNHDMDPTWVRVQVTYQ